MPQLHIKIIKLTVNYAIKKLYLTSPAILAMCPKMWANELGIMPLSSGVERTPSMVNVLPVPVWPYANIVPE